ncbi:MAG: 4Fe-4S dicluster domain-containing protein [Sphaerochaeta sp.]|nr:4Fe-4S dicluster domain-containing protein [Sphaerochaeta sp.]
MMRIPYRLGNTLSFISFILFPVTLNFFSPYVSIDGALQGVITGSLVLFFLLYLSGIFLGRAWCSHLCPWSAPSDFLMSINNRCVDRKRLRIIRYAIFGIWITALVLAFVAAGGIRSVDPLHLTEKGISTDQPVKYITYYMVVLLLFITTVLVGRRGACHGLCWMSPFLVFGMKTGELLHLPRLRVVSKPESCISCNACTRVCPMSLDVQSELRKGTIGSSDCILCNRCVDVCPSQVLHVRMGKGRSKEYQVRN